MIYEIKAIKRFKSGIFKGYEMIHIQQYKSLDLAKYTLLRLQNKEKKKLVDVVGNEVEYINLELKEVRN